MWELMPAPLSGSCGGRGNRGGCGEGGEYGTDTV
jgi:hypothetical protein